MSQSSYSSLSDERLLELFAEGAKQVGLVTSRNEMLRWVKGLRETKPVVDNEARMAIAARTREIVDALRERNSLATINRLLEDGDPDVRAIASIAFADLAPNLSFAAAQAAYAGLPTDRVAELQRRAREKPPQRPTLIEMNDEELVARFKDAVEREYGTHFLDCLEDPADKDLQNEIVLEVCDVMRALKSRDLLSSLLPLLASDNLTVRREAATACLRVDEPRSVAALESVSRDGDYPDNMEARDALARWRAKGSAVYGV